MKRVTALQIAAGVAIGAVGVWIFLRQVDATEMFREMRQTPFWKITIVVALSPATLLLRAWRWKVMLPQRSECSKKGLFPLVAIGFMVNNFFPARIGEAARAVLLWKRNRFTIAESVGSLLAERFLDVLVYVLFLILPIVFLPKLSVIRNYGVLLAGGLCGVLLCFFAYTKNPALSKRVAKRCLAIIPVRFRTVIIPIGKELISNLDWLFSFKRTVSVIILSLLTPLCYVAMVQVLGYGITGFDAWVSMFGIAFAAIGAAIPLAPGYVGTLHAMMLSGLALAGIAADKAGAIVVIYHAIGYVAVAVMGIYYFFNLKISMKEIRESKGSEVGRRSEGE
ncbi:MAG: flippase-like domain-containing protein [Chitinispirillaceae bacterium]|nr:flippase-like domain-containing protein [Chitinispirillaceae bacterium]